MIRFLGLKLSLNKLETNKEKPKRKNNSYERTESKIHFGKGERCRSKADKVSDEGNTKKTVDNGPVENSRRD